MKVSRGFALSCLLTLAASPAFAQFSLSDAANVVSAMQGNQAEQGEGAVAAAPKAAGLLNTQGSELKITPEQAIGGAVRCWGWRRTCSANRSLFSELRIGQFAPVILQYLGQQGVGSSLLQNLGGIWGAGAGV